MIDLLGYFGWTMLLAGFSHLFARGFQLTPTSHARLWLVFAGLGLLPIGGGNLVYLFRGVLGDLSMAMVVLLIISNYQQIEFNRYPECHPFLSLAVVLLLTMLYLSTLGYLQVDLYAIGYQPGWMLAGLFLMLAVAWKLCRVQALAWLFGIIYFATDATP
ncbi:MAG TPA: hypothetical protein PKD72_01075, partial [Gemmatales bacterium]|nr:hypothetical protein [Gemmatales bacterium]